MRVVHDTVILLRAMLDPYSWWGKIIFDNFDRYEMIVSNEVVDEYLDVLHRPSLRRKYRQVANRDLDTLLGIVNDATSVSLREIPAIARDHEDDHLLATALTATADFLVTEDKDLLVLKSYFSTKIVTGQSFLQTLQSE